RPLRARPSCATQCATPYPSRPSGRWPCPLCGRRSVASLRIAKKSSGKFLPRQSWPSRPARRRAHPTDKRRRTAAQIPTVAGNLLPLGIHQHIGGIGFDPELSFQPTVLGPLVIRESVVLGKIHFHHDQIRVFKLP